MKTKNKDLKREALKIYSYLRGTGTIKGKLKSHERIIAEYKYSQFCRENCFYGIERKNLPSSNTDKEIFQRIEIYKKEAKDKISKIKKNRIIFNELGGNFQELFKIIYGNKYKIKEEPCVFDYTVFLKRISRRKILNFITLKEFDSLDLKLEICTENYYKKRFNTYSLIEVLEQIYKNKIKLSFAYKYIDMKYVSQKDIEDLKNSDECRNDLDEFFIHQCFILLKDKIREEELISKLIDKNDVNTTKTKKKIWHCLFIY